MAKTLKIRYTVQSGPLPNGLTLNPDTGLLEGNVGWDALGLGPRWTGPKAGSIGAYNENDPFDAATFSATTDKTPVRYSIVGGVIPWGLVFNAQSGMLTGTISPLKQRTNETASNYDGPAWNTSFGTLANFDEGSTSSLVLSATPIGNRTMRGFQIVDGYLPWGLRLDLNSGIISGNTAPLKNPGAYVDVPKLPVPVWTTPGGTMGTFDELATFNLTLAATPASGRSMAKYNINRGALPFGLRLNQRTGAITGDFANMFVEEASFVDPANNPTISNAMVIQSGNAIVADGGSLGSYAKGTEVSIGLIARAITGRQIKSYQITSGYLPFGLRLNLQNGVISGTVLNNIRTQSGTYTFTVQVYDKGDALLRQNSVSRTYSITVQ